MKSNHSYPIIPLMLLYTNHCAPPRTSLLNGFNLWHKWLSKQTQCFTCWGGVCWLRHIAVVPDLSLSYRLMHCSKSGTLYEMKGSSLCRIVLMMITEKMIIQNGSFVVGIHVNNSQCNPCKTAIN